MTGKLLLAKLLHKPRGKANQARGEQKLGAKPKTRWQQASRYWVAEGRRKLRKLGKKLPLLLSATGLLATKGSREEAAENANPS